MSAAPDMPRPYSYGPGKDLTSSHRERALENLRSHVWVRPGLSAAGITGVGMLAVREIPQGTSIFEMGEIVGRLRPEYVKLSEADLGEAQIHENDLVQPSKRNTTLDVFPFSQEFRS